MDKLTDAMYVEITLASGVRCRVWVTENCAVIEANGIVTSAARYSNWAMPVDRAAELAPLLAAAGTRP